MYQVFEDKGKGKVKIHNFNRKRDAERKALALMRNKKYAGFWNTTDNLLSKFFNVKEN